LVAVKRLAALALLMVAAGGACGQDGGDGQTTASPTPKLEVSEAQLEDALLEAKDVGSGWEEQKDPAPSTVQIGGRKGWGPANMEDTDATAIAAFRKPPAYLITHLYVVDTPLVAEAIIDAHERAGPVTTWTQERTDGGARFKRAGPVEDLPQLGDETYSARLSATIVDEEGKETKRRLQYVVFRTDRIVAFVITQDVGVQKYATRQEQKLASLTS
jgi:hypothetical protein